MNDPKNHSIEIWRTFAIEYPQLKVKNIIEAYCQDKDMKYSYQNYGQHGNEPPHISFRIAFPDTESLTEFREHLYKTLDEENKDEYILDYLIQERGYDESAGVKMAYVVGTELYNSVMDHHTLFTKNWSEHLLLILHGFFNDFGWGYEDELDFYLYCSGRIVNQMRGRS